MRTLKKFNQSIQDINLTIEGGFALVFFLFVFGIALTFLVTFIQLNIQWFTQTLSSDDEGTLLLYYGILIPLIYLIKNTTITNNKQK